MLLQGKTVVVTGVGTGLGSEMATALFGAGAKVVLAARTTRTIETIATELDPSGGRVLTRAADIRDEDAGQALVDATVDRFGTLDALVQVAAYENAFGGLFDADLGNWLKAFETNVLGSVKLLRAAVPAMKKAGGGSVVLVGTQSMFKPALPQAGYAASKSALLSTMYYLADELGPDGIRINMVVPSWMWGPPVEMYVDYRAKSEGKDRNEVLTEMTSTFPLRRMTEDGEVADVAVFFCSDLSRAITGQHLMVNCGEMMR